MIYENITAVKLILQHKKLNQWTKQVDKNLLDILE